MTKKEEFKEFVKKNPSLINHINNNEMTWQKFYELYDMYGNDNNIWDKYINTRESSNIDSVQSGVNNLQKVVDIIQDFGHKSTKKEEYKPRPLYKHFDD